MGRPRKPDELKKWQGTLRPCRVNKKAPQPAALPKTAKAAIRLSRSAKAHYKNITELLNRGGILRETDNYWITLCADMIAKAADASRRLDTEGQVLENDKGILYPHPAGVIYFRAAEIAMKCLSRCGMNPADRGKIIGDEIKRETNPFAELEAEFGSGKGSNTTTTNDADCEGLAIRK